MKNALMATLVGNKLFISQYIGGVFVRRVSVFDHSPPVLVFASLSPNNLEFSPCLRIWPILCTQFMTMVRVVVGSSGCDILCC